MKIRFHLLAVLFAGFLATPARAADGLEALQGKWEGSAAAEGGVAPEKPKAGFHIEGLDLLAPAERPTPADKPHDKLTITITGDSFHFHRDPNFWFETTITLPSGTDPRQLRATIKSAAPSQGDAPLGKMVTAIYKIEDGTLTLATGGGEEAPKSFDAVDDKSLTIYQLRKVSPQKKESEPAKTK